MIVNGQKTKEILFCSILKDLPLFATLKGTPVERVTTFKLLGVHVTNDLNWMQHVDLVEGLIETVLPKAA